MIIGTGYTQQNSVHMDKTIYPLNKYLQLNTINNLPTWPMKIMFMWFFFLSCSIGGLGFCATFIDASSSSSLYSSSSSSSLAQSSAASNNSTTIKISHTQKKFLIISDNFYHQIQVYEQVCHISFIKEIYFWSNQFNTLQSNIVSALKI